MAAEAVLTSKLSYEEYLQLEKQEGIRYEYYNGEVVAMAGVSLNHNRITSNIDRSLANLLEGGSCEIFQEVVKLVHSKSNSFLYPDILITCDREDKAASHTIKKPVLIVEVLSPSTEGKDRGEKLAVYCTIPTLRYYLLISQTSPYVEVYSREQSLAVFQYRMFRQMTDSIEFPDLGFRLTLEQIYRNVRFEPNDLPNRAS